VKFSEAAATVMPWGMYRGKTIDQIAETDRGLAWLDWMRGELDRDAVGKHGIHDAIKTYLADPTIASDLAKLAKHKD
jgi:hypothetical protein